MRASLPGSGRLPEPEPSLIALVTSARFNADDTRSSWSRRQTYDVTRLGIIGERSFPRRASYVAAGGGRRHGRRVACLLDLPNFSSVTLVYTTMPPKTRPNDAPGSRKAGAVRAFLDVAARASAAS